MQTNNQLDRCLRMVDHLDVAYGWNLGSSLQQHYARNLALYLNDASTKDTVLRTMVCNFHADRVEVEALRDPLHPEHASRWEDWKGQMRRILLSRAPHISTGPEGAVCLDDLVQEALTDVWRGLQSFGYRSQLRTWVYTIAGNCLHRYFRSLNTLKRGATVETQSLDTLLAVADTISDQTSQTPEQQAVDALFMKLLRDILAQQPDRRLLQIFDLWAHDQQTLQAIGTRLDLSATRVFTLLRQATTLLQDELVTCAWIDDDALDRSGTMPVMLQAVAG